MKHHLIAIGCNSYDHVSSLEGAEGDATRIFNLLTDDRHGDCNRDSSTLVLSPSLTQLKEKLLIATSKISQGDIITIFFAGHGHVKAGIFYLCLRDTQPDRIGLTGLPLNSLLSLLRELGPKHANLVIDACNSGGVIGDFARALSPDNVGSSGTIGISLLAACAQDQYAYEINKAGICTDSIARCIDGTEFVQDLTENLDLLEVAARVAQKAGSSRQQPVFWGLNLTGRPNFCKNPHMGPDSPLRRVLAEASPLNLSAQVKTALHEIYNSMDSDWNPRLVRQTLSDFYDATELDPLTKLNFTAQLLQSFRAKSQFCNDPFKEVEVTAAFLAPLLSSCSNHHESETFVLRECSHLADITLAKTRIVVEALEADETFLVGGMGVGELFMLPLRVSALLGWAGWAIHVRMAAGGGLSDATFVHNLVGRVLSGLSGTLRAVCDEQAPYLCVAASALRLLGLTDESEELVGHYFHDAACTRGNIARVELDSSKIIDFLISRAQDKPDFELVSNPSSLLFVILILGAKMDLDEAFDYGLCDLDHLNVNAYIPETYCDFWMKRMEGGYNATIRVGNDVWTVADIRRIFMSLDLPRPENQAVALLSAMCSLLYPDRVPLHILTTSAPR